MASVDDPSPSISGWDEIIDVARSHQYDRYLAATLAPREARADLIVLAAFAGEMARIPWTVSEPTIGAIRLQWWRDAISADSSETTGNPLADAVRACVIRRRLPVAQLHSHIDAQELELYADPAADRKELDIHFAKRDGSMFALSTRVLGGQTGGDLHALTTQAAQAYGLAKSLTEFQIRRRGCQLLLPGDSLSNHGIDPAALDAVDPLAVRALLSELADTICGSYSDLRQPISLLDRPTRTALLPVALTATYIGHTRRQLDAAKPSETGPAPLQRAWRMLIAHLSGRF